MTTDLADSSKKMHKYCDRKFFTNLRDKEKISYTFKCILLFQEHFKFQQNKHEKQLKQYYILQKKIYTCVRSRITKKNYCDIQRRISGISAFLIRHIAFLYFLLYIKNPRFFTGILPNK